MRLGCGIVGLFAVMGFYASESRAEFHDDFYGQVFKYAPDPSASLDLKDTLTYSSEHIYSQTHLYFASGPQGTWSFDPDPLKYTNFVDDDHHTMFWFGRDQPLSVVRGQTISPFSALGSIWAQNQSDALLPRVSGWIGAGFVQDISSNWKVLGTFSPIFLPTFGPSLGFDSSGNINPERFASLPPADANTGGVTVPIRYQLDTGNLANIVFHYQALTGVSFDNSDIHFDIYAYTAPKPDVVALTNSTLAVNSMNANAHVVINPEFPREYWSGTRLSFKNLPFTPAVELVQNLVDYPTHI
jgi:hypothetical protein